MANNIKIRAWMGDGGRATVKAILFHPMETGLRKDKATGKVIEAHYITEVKCEHNGKNVLTCLWGPGVSKNPFLSFRFKDAKAGDTLKISWVDNKGGTASNSAKIS
ncbi:MAG: thiosulfate oxidation carrier complex protein SoxZ [Gammaproteobacteria bacterium]|nr:thiosulfate oxidation carrier complex protein SoxZ [Gammaproteobacteria bacterium]MDH5653043.1 thiosulfate oxidation carrier complex protein SoxZ [Gammaproteobacteria bacterium]